MQDSVEAERSPQSFPVEFQGTATEYFRIWIVNLALSIVTLGVYSAWAKVRTRRYFYNHTLINGQRFDYHADPIRILKGRIVLAVFFAIYFSARFYPALWAVVAVLLLFVPWLVVRGMIFNMANSSFRGIRFGFERDYRGSYVTYAKGAALTLVSLGILGLRWPLWFRRFTIPRTRFGRTSFKFQADTRPYDAIFGKAVLMYVGAIVVLVAVGAMASGVLKSSGSKTMAAVMVGVFVFAIYAMAFLVGFWLRAQLMNFFWPRTQLGELRFETSYTGWDLFLVSLQNGLAILFTLGLAWPWAAIEMARFKASGLRVLGRPEDFESFHQGEVASLGATGEEVLGIWDVDLGF